MAKEARDAIGVRQRHDADAIGEGQRFQRAAAQQADVAERLFDRAGDGDAIEVLDIETQALAEVGLDLEPAVHAADHARQNLE